jgi:DNA ligase-1
MKAFTQLYSGLDSTTKTNEKIGVMMDYFQQADADSAIWAVALLTGRRPKRPIRTSDLKTWATGLAGIPVWLFEESYHVVGDLAETISLLVPTKGGSSEKTLSTVMREIVALAPQPDEEKKRWLYSYWNNMSREELFVFNKLITGSFRVGVSQQLVFKALARVYESEERVIAHQLMGNWTPQSTTLQQLLRDGAGSADHTKPYPFYLAYQLDIPFSEMGAAGDWIIERKYDGIRGQLIARADEINLWSRGEELMTDKFIEFQELKGLIPNGTVIDGEVLPCLNDKILSFNELQKRIGRKNVSKKMLQEVPLCLMCYDLLEHQGQDTRSLPLHERRRLLGELVKGLGHPTLKLSPVLPATAWEELGALREESRSLGCEGLMLKHGDSIYETGRRRGKWWKWKVDPYTVDAVLIYAQSGHGRRANLYTDYTFAVWDKDELVPFAKAYSGLSDKEIVEVDSWIKRHTLEKFGPVRSVKAELVFELAFEGINASPRHKSGIALRFPRILRWRKDKTKEEINTKEDLLQLLGAR